MKKIGAASFIIYLATIPFANWMIQHVGTVKFPGGPHVLPVGLGFSAPSGVYIIGFALVARDLVQLILGRRLTVAAIVIGSTLSYLIAPSVALASATAFFLGEVADFAVYTPLARRKLYLAVLASGIAGATIDSLVFLKIAFGNFDYWQGNALGKVWMSLLALPFLGIVRRAVLDNSSSIGN